MSESDLDSDFDGYADNPELDSEEEEYPTSSFHNYPSHLFGLATSCTPSTRQAPPPSMFPSLTPTFTHSTVLASSVFSTAHIPTVAPSTALFPTVAPSTSLALVVVPSTVLAPSASSIVLGPY